MKKIQLLLLISCFIIISAAGAQPADTIKSIAPRLNSDLLFQKARNQKTAAWVFLGAGAGLAIAGIVVGESSVYHIGTDPIDKISSDLQTGSVLLVAGGASMLASVPFFIASGKNRRKARLQLSNGSSFISRLPLFKRNFISVEMNIQL
jgi:hypothetical protein